VSSTVSLTDVPGLKCSGSGINVCFRYWPPPQLPKYLLTSVKGIGLRFADHPATGKHGLQLFNILFGGMPEKVGVEGLLEWLRKELLREPSVRWSRYPQIGGEHPCGA
jgi:hypothetical protein